MTWRIASLVAIATASIAAIVVPNALREMSAITTSYDASIEPSSSSLVVDGYELLAGSVLFRDTARRLVSGKATDRERLDVLMDWTHENVRPQYAAPDRVVADNFLDIVRRGYGFCDQSAHVFATLAYFSGYEARLLFLQEADGVSPHSVAEVRVADRWVVVDPLIGSLYLDGDGRMVGVEDIERVDLAGRYRILPVIDAADFERGTRYRTYPYIDLPGLMGKVWARISGQGARDVPDEGSRAPAPEDPRSGSQAGPVAERATLVELDAARRAHLEGRYREAAEGYLRVLQASPPSDIRGSVRFFLGLALLRAGDALAAVSAFDTALGADPAGWRPSVPYFRAEAKERLGDLDGAVEDLRAADIPPGVARLARLLGR